MNCNHRKINRISAVVLVLVMTLSASVSQAYIDLAPTLAKIIGESRTIAVVEVVEFNRDQHTVTLRPISTLKGEALAEQIRHDVAPADGGAIPRPIMQWAAPGARGVLFGSRATSLVCIGQGWYQVRSGAEGVWKLGNDRPDLPLAYYGSISRLADGVQSMIAGKEATLTVVAFGADNEGASFDLALNRPSLPGLVRVQRIRANLNMPQMVMAASANPAYFLGVGPVDQADVQQLIAKLKSADPHDRAEAAEDLCSLGRKAVAATDALKEHLKETDARVRIWAAAALLHIDPSQTAAIDQLNDGLNDSNASTRREAARAAGLAGAAAGPLTKRLADLLSDKDESVRITALQAIATIGRPASAAATAVIPLLDQPEMAIDAADALGRLGPAGRPALKKLATMLQSDQSATQWAAVRAMSQIGGEEAHPAVDYMIKALPRATEVEGYNMMIYLSLLGPVAKDALPTVRNTPIKNPVLPSATEWAISPETSFPWLGGMGRGGRGGRGPGGGPGGPGGGPGGPGMGGGDIFTFIYQSYVRELGDRLAPAAGTLAQKIMDGSAGEVPTWGYDILSCGPDRAVAVFAPHLKDEDLNLRERATVALGFMGHSAAAAKPQLQAALDRASSEREKHLIEWSIRQIEKQES